MGRLLTVARLVAAAAILAATVGCSHNTPSSAPTNPPDRWPSNLSELHFVWSADPGIDLLIQPAVVVRAYIESVLLASFGGSMDYLYPGFAKAVAPDQPVGSASSTVSLWPALDPDSQKRAGTDQHHILRVTESGRDLTAVVCGWTWGFALQQPNGMYRIKSSTTGPLTGVYVTRLNLEAPTDPNVTKMPPQQGKSIYATTDVFNGWRIVGKLEASGWLAMLTEWPDFNQDLDACAARAPESVERREYLTSADRPRTDFPTLPASPGWPAESQ